MAKKSLLLLSYYFPPMNIIGAARPYHMAKQFHDRGWDVTVLCCEDPSVPETFATETSFCRVVRVKVPQLLAWLNSGNVGAGRGLRKIRSFVERAVRVVARSVLFPEPYVLARTAIQERAEQLMDASRYDLVVSSALPFTMHLIARALSKKKRVPWIADNRDLWASSPYRRLLLPRRAYDIRFERAVLQDAALVLGVTGAMERYYRDICKLTAVRKVMNGYLRSSLDPVGGDSVRQGPELDIVYAGGLYGGFRDPSPLFEAIASDPCLRERVRISFYGAEAEITSALIRKYPQCLIYENGKVSKKDIHEVYRKASILLVVLGDSVFDKGVLTGKFFEYLGFSRQILAIASDDAELSDVINSFNIGYSGRDPAKISEYLRGFVVSNRDLKIDPPKELSVESQMGSFCEYVEKFLDEKIVVKN